MHSINNSADKPTVINSTPSQNQRPFSLNTLQTFFNQQLESLTQDFQKLGKDLNEVTWLASHQNRIINLLQVQPNNNTQNTVKDSDLNKVPLLPHRNSVQQTHENQAKAPQTEPAAYASSSSFQNLPAAYASSSSAQNLPAAYASSSSSSHSQKQGESTKKINSKRSVDSPISSAKKLICDAPFEDLRIKRIRSTQIDTFWRARAVQPDEVHVLESRNIRIVDADTGKLLLVFVTNVNLAKHQPLLNQMYNHCAGKRFCTTSQRGDAGGKFDATTHGRKQEDYVVRPSGIMATLKNNKQAVGNLLRSMTLGFQGHSKGNLCCREVEAKNHRSHYEILFPILKDIASIFERCAPVQFQNQVRALQEHKILAEREGLKHYQIEGLPFTTLTLNVSQNGKPTTHVHRDSNDLKEGFICLFVDGQNYTGGLTAFPELKIMDPRTQEEKILALDVRPNTVLLFNGTELLHGNTPVNLTETGRRVSYVAYVQEILTTCTQDRCKNYTGTKNKQILRLKSKKD